VTEIVFEWDEEKNILNKKQHGIDFEDAKLFCRTCSIVRKKNAGLLLELSAVFFLWFSPSAVRISSGLYRQE
jgi:hypothetical protein